MSLANTIQTFFLIAFCLPTLFSNSFCYKQASSSFESKVETMRIVLYSIDSDLSFDSFRLCLETKDGIFVSSSVSYELKHYQNWNSNLFYYCDVPLTVRALKIQSYWLTNGTLFGETKWCYDIFPARLYKFYKSGSKMTCGPCNLSPDAGALSLELASLSASNSSYVNGYSGFGDFEVYWLKYYSDGLGSQFLSSTYIVDCVNDCVGQSRKISLTEKISELREQYNQNAHFSSPSELTRIYFSLFFLGLTFLFASLLFSLLIFHKTKRKIGLS